jgi:serine/threonine protein kinase/class 3 adenylate cyclase
MARAAMDEEPRQHSTTLTILLAEVVGSPRYSPGIGETAGLASGDRHRELAAGAIAEFHGKVISTTGDSTLAEFPEPAFAVRVAVELQRCLLLLNQKLPESERLQLCVGISQGAAIRRGAEVSGDAVELARRITQRSSPAQILIPRPVREGIVLEADLRCTWLGKITLQGRAEKEDIFEVIWTDTATYADLRATVTAALARGDLKGPGVDAKDFLPPARPPTPIPTEQPTSDISSAVAQGDMASRYDILEEVGRGGMGIVYKGRDRETGELVALKALKPEIAQDSSAMERFKNELRLTRRITHKNVCRIHEFNRTGTTAYISMEFVQGDSLRHVLNAFGGLPLRKGLDVAQQICAGLREAHAQGIVHRDLKPENIMLDRAGNVKIMDFGIARSIESSASLTGSIVGTPAYMAPEQAQGKPVDHRADIYSLGLILYELFTGSAAFRGDTPVAVAFKQVHETPPSPREIEPTLPGYLEKAIVKCLEKNPAKRFQSVDELEAAFTRKGEAKPAVAEAEAAEVPLPLHLTRWQRSDYALLAAAFLSLLVFLSLFDRAFPYSAVKIMPKEEAAKVVKAGLAKLGVDASPQNGSLGLELWLYPQVAAMSGPAAARRFLEEFGPAWWWFPIEGPEIPKGRWVTWAVDNMGRAVWVNLPVRPRVFPKGINAAQESKLAGETISALFGQQVSRVQPRVTSPQPGEIWYAYELSDSSLGFPKVLALALGNDYFRVGESLRAGFYWYGDWDSPTRAPEVLAILALCAAGLFFLRRLHRRPTSWANMALAVIATTLVFTAFHGALTSAAWEVVPLGIREVGKQSLSPDWIMPLKVILESLLWVLLVALGYCVLTAVEYYMKRSDPGRLRTFAELLKPPWSYAPAGLALIRGLFLGLLFAAAYVALLALAGHLRLAFPDPEMLVLNLAGRWSFSSVEGSPADGQLVALRSITVILVEALILGWVLIAFPAALLRRVTARPGAMVSLTILLWLGTGYCPAGMSTTPVASFYLGLALLALSLSLVYLRWDLLTALVTIFTLESWLFGYAVLKLFHSLDSVLYSIPLLLWFAFAVLAFAVAFRVQLTAAYRRVAAVFE